MRELYEIIRTVTRTIGFVVSLGMALLTIMICLLLVF